MIFCLKDWKNLSHFLYHGSRLCLGCYYSLAIRQESLLFLAAGLFIVFIVAIETNLARGRINLDCGCFGGRHRQVIGFKTILRNLVLIALCGLLAFWDGGLLVVDDLPMATQRLILDIYVIDILLPLALAAAGLFLLVRLIRQLARLVSLTSMEYRQ